MKRFRLGDIVRGVRHGGTPPTDNDAFWVGDIPWITGADILNQKVGDIRRYVNMKAVKTTSTNIVSKGDLLLVTRTGVGKMAVAPYDVAISQDFTGLTFNDQVADTRFLYYALQGKTNELLIFNQGTSINGVTRADLLNLELELPEKAEQTAIADILATVDQAIEQTEALIAKQRRIKAGLLHDLLTRGIDEHGHLRDPSTHGFKPSPVGLVPEEWEVNSIGRVAKHVTDGDHHTPKRSDSGVFLLSARNVLDGELDLSDVDFVAEDEYQRMIKRCFPEAGDVLISCSGTIGRVCLVPGGFRCGLVRSVALVKFDHAQCLPDYGSWAMRSHSVRKQIIASQLQAAQPNLFQGAIRGIHIALPELQEQQVIASVLDSADDFIASGKAHKLKLVRLKTGLMQDLLGGRVSVAGLMAEKNVFPYDDPTHNPKDSL